MADLSNLLQNRIFGVLAVFLGLFVVLKVAAALLGDVFTSIGDVNQELKVAQVNDTLANTLLNDVFPIVVGLALALAVIGVILAVGRKKSGGA